MRLSGNVLESLPEGLVQECLDQDGGLIPFEVNPPSRERRAALGKSYGKHAAGLAELGMFLWSQYEQFDESQWKRQVLEWLPVLLPMTLKWNDRQALDECTEFLIEHLQYKDAVLLRRRHLTLTASEFGNEDINTAESMDALGTALRTSGDYREAEQLHRGALGITENLLGPNHPDTGRDFNNLALLLKAKGSYDEAEQFYRRALSVAELAQESEGSDTGTALENLAGLLRAKREYKSRNRWLVVRWQLLRSGWVQRIPRQAHE